LQLPAYQSQAAELSAEIGRLNDAAAARDAEIGRLKEAAAMRIAEIGRLNDHLSSRDMELQSVKTERDAQIVWLSDERTRLNGQLDGYAATLDALQGRYDKLQGRYDKRTRSFRWRFVDGLVHLPRTAGRAVRWPFIRVAFHKNGRPRGWLRRLGFKSRATGLANEGVSRVGHSPESTSSGAALRTADLTAAVLDRRKATILVVSHEASRTGAPILGLNLVQQLSARYNVISLILGGGELIDHFSKAGAAVRVIDVRHMDDRELDRDIEAITAQYPLTFAIVNSVESRRVLKALKNAAVPTVTLIHEFSAYTRPRSAIPDVIVQSTMTVFSTRITLENAVSDFRLNPGSSIYVEPQGKCIVPASLTGASEASSEKLWLSRMLRPEGGHGKFLVIGAGAVQLRKGVDLFIDCATILANQPGGERFQFVWIGSGYDTDLDGIYSVYLADQMERGQVESQVKILRPTSQIEVAYRAADLFLLSSRLDPLPNVAIDALTLGLPVLCFEKTTGIADFLLENGLGDECVAKYLDTHDLARKVKALADSDELRARVSARCRVAAEKEYDMNAYGSKIEAIALRAAGSEARLKEEVNTILSSGRFRSDFFKDAPVASASEEQTVENYLRRVGLGTSVRKPMPGFHPAVYSWLRKSADWKSADWRDTDPFVDFLRKGLPEGPWLQRVIESGAQLKPASNAPRVALHLHAFYPDQVAGIVERLNLNISAPDLFASVLTSDAASETRQALSGYRGRIVDVQMTPNLGRDIGPLLMQFGRDLCASYDIVGHLHTKKSPQIEDRAFAEAWNIFLLENLVGGEDGGPMLDLILCSMAADLGIGIVFPDDPNVISWTKNRKHAEALADRMNYADLPEELNFPIGSMFWVRSSVLLKFVELGLTWDDFAPEPLPVDGTMIHAIERLFGVVPAKMGMTCAVTNVRGVTR
jgi:glycosyltransferase involved in cell wall biosynthesis